MKLVTIFAVLTLCVMYTAALPVQPRFRRSIFGTSCTVVFGCGTSIPDDMYYQHIESLKTVDDKAKDCVALSQKMKPKPGGSDPTPVDADGKAKYETLKGLLKEPLTNPNVFSGGSNVFGSARCGSNPATKVWIKRIQKKCGDAAKCEQAAKKK